MFISGSHVEAEFHSKGLRLYKKGRAKDVGGMIDFNVDESAELIVFLEMLRVGSKVHVHIGEDEQESPNTGDQGYM